MRFVKDLIPTAALATVVAGLPAGNTHVSSDTDTDIDTGKASITPVSPLPSGAVSVWEGSDGHVTLTGFPTVAVIVTESSSAPTDRVSVTPATIIEPHPGSSTVPPAHELDAQVTYLPKPPVGPGGGHPGAFVEGRQMLPLPSSSTSALSERQMLPLPSSSTSALSERQMLPLPSSSTSALSARNKAYTSPGTPFGAQPDPKVAIAGAVSTVTETSLHIITASLTAPSTTPTTTVIVTVTIPRPVTSASDKCTGTAHPYAPSFSLPVERTTSSTKTRTRESVDPGNTVPGNSATTVVSTVCEDSHTSCFSHTLTSTDVVTSSSTTYTGGPPSEAMPSHPLTGAADVPPCIGSCSEWSAWAESTSTTCSDSTTLVTVTTDTTSTLTGIQTIGMGSPTPSLAPRDQDPTFSVDPSDLPTMPPFKRGAQVSPTLTASYTITFTQPPDEPQPATYETLGEPHNTPPHNTPPPITRRDQDPTFSVDPSDLPTMPPRPVAGEPHRHTTITNKAPGLPTHTPEPISRRDEAGPLDPRPPFTSVQPRIIPPPPYWTIRTRYTEEDYKTEGASPTTLATSVVRYAA